MSEKVFKSLVRIKDGNKKPLYVIHGLGLNILNFKLLADRMDADQPLLALQAQGLDEVENSSNDVRDFAKCYLDEILMHDAEGPYLLAGYSSGAFIALEMGHQLELMGKEVNFLGVLDMSTQIIDYNIAISFPDKLKIDLLHSIWIIKHPLLTAKMKFKSIFRQISLAFSNKEIKGYYRKLHEIQDLHRTAYKKYKGVPIRADIHVFRAQNNILFEVADQFSGWKKYTRGQVKIYKVQGDHFTMLSLPNVIELATLLQNALNNC